MNPNHPHSDLICAFKQIIHDTTEKHVAAAILAAANQQIQGSIAIAAKLTEISEKMSELIEAVDYAKTK